MTKRHKRHRGFTLVELIVVIAIVGVLAAILIPSFLGFAKQARIASANSTAGMLRDEVNRWLLDLNTKGMGMFFAEGSTDYLAIVCEDGNWKVKTDLKNVDVWDMPIEGALLSMKSDVLVNTLNLNYQQSQPASFTAYLVKGHCKYLVYNPNSNEPITAFGDLSDDGTLDWKYDESLFISEGVLKGGTLIGTAPAITR